MLTVAVKRLTKPRLVGVTLKGHLSLWEVKLKLMNRSEARRETDTKILFVQQICIPLTSSERGGEGEVEGVLSSAAGRWEVVWHLDIRQYLRRVSEYQQCVGVQVWLGGGGWGGAGVLRGGISTEPRSRCCRCEWVLVWTSRDSSPYRSLLRIPLLPAHYHLQASLRTFLKPDWHGARPHIEQSLSQ